MASSSLSGLKIRTARKELGVPQSKLARQAGISASYLTLIELNKRALNRLPHLSAFPGLFLCKKQQRMLKLYELLQTQNCKEILSNDNTA